MDERGATLFHTINVLTDSNSIRSAYKRAKIQSTPQNQFAFVDLSKVPLTSIPKTNSSIVQIVMTDATSGFHAVSLNPSWKSVFAASHKVILADPTSKPSAIGDLTYSMKVPSKSSFGVFDVDDFSKPETSHLIHRICHAFTNRYGDDAIVSAQIVNDQLRIVGPRLRRLMVPISALACITGKDPDQIRQFHLHTHGRYLHWPQWNIHLGWNQFLQAVDPQELHHARQRSLKYNRQYGKAIRAFRESLSLTQNHIEGLTDRQIRRIETGESRATTAAMQSLADAHGLTVNQYMQEIATRIQ
jgi:hypothetical protein